MKKVVFQGQTIALDPNKSLGDGGEAVVIRHGKLAFKIYHDPGNRKQKIADFIKSDFNLPSNVIKPLDIVTDTNGKFVGFTMQIISGCRDFMKLCNVKFRRTEQLTSNDIIKLFVHTKETLDSIHTEQIVVGDFNDLNQLFTDKMNAQFIDVDSYQFGTHPCIVATDMYCDPNLYGIDLTKKPNFTKETDWYAFAVMLFRCLLLVHPYGGVHKIHKSIFTRAKNSIWVLDKQVMYPKIGLNPDTLSDELLGHFARIFNGAKREDFPVSLLQNQKFIKCKKCNAYFSNTRQKCPQCQKVAPISVNITQIITKKTIGKENCQVTALFNTSGIILFAKVINYSVGERVVVIDYDGNHTNIHIIGQYKQKLWSGHTKHVRFDFFTPSCLAVYHDNALLIFNVDETGLRPLTTLTTSNYREEPVFCCSNDCLYRLTSTMIMQGKLVSNHYLEQTVSATTQDQTWIQFGRNNIGLGFHRVFSQYQYFVISPQKHRYEVSMSALDGQLIDINVLFSINRILLLRKTLYKGRTYSYWHLIDDKGNVLEEQKEESINSELLKNIHGKVLAGSNIIHPTDAGIAVEKHGDVSLKVSTAEHVNDNSQLFLYDKGLLVVNEKTITYLTIT